MILPNASLLVIKEKANKQKKKKKKKPTYFFKWVINYFCIQIPVGSVFHPHTRTQCLRDLKAHYPRGGYTKGPQKSGYFQIPIIPSLWVGGPGVPIYSLPAIYARGCTALFKPNMSWHIFLKIMSSYDVFENLMDCQHFKIGKFHIKKIQISSLSQNGKRS